VLIIPIVAQVTAAVPLPLTDPVYIFCILLLTIGLAPLFAEKLRLPSLVMLIVIGAILGTNVLGILERSSAIQLLEKIGLLYIMLLAGMQMNLGNLKQVGIRALIFGGLTFGCPFAIGLLLAYLLHYPLLTGLLLGILFSPHTLISYPIAVRLNILSQEAISVAIGGTAVTSILTLSGLSVVQSIVGTGLNIWVWVKIGLGLPLLAIVSFWVVGKFATIILSKEFPSASQQFLFILGTLFVIASSTLLLGIDSIVGGFIAGLALNRFARENPAVVEPVEFVGSNLFIPCFLISVGLLSNPKILIQHPENLGLAVLVVVCAVGAKFLAAWISGILFRYTMAEVLTMTGLTLSRAALVLVIALYGSKAVLPGTTDVPLLGEGLFNAILVYILVTCFVGPLVTNQFGQQMILTKAEDVAQIQAAHQDG
jgi:Kef-type K+ transport system membrane component KefB